MALGSLGVIAWARVELGADMYRGNCHHTAQQCTAVHGAAQHGTAWHSMAQHGTAWHGMAQHSTAQHGMHGTS
jgi:hypothetical protein